MITFCKACDNPLVGNAQFCSKCGAPAADAPEPSADHLHAGEEPVALPIAGPAEFPASFTESASFDKEPERPPVRELSDRSSPNWLFIGGGLAALLLIALLYYFLFIADDMTPSTETAVAEQAEEAVGEEQRLFTMTTANIRDKPTVNGSEILGKLPRGSAISGRLVNGSDDASSTWLELKDGNGYVSTVNLTDFQPPELIKSLNGKSWAADASLDIWKQPAPESELIDRVSEGAKLTLNGITANDYMEVKLATGGLGYISGGAAIEARLGGKPVELAFNPNSCAFGQEIEVMFQRLGEKARGEWDALERKDFATEEAREAALSKLEGKSHYEKMQRSWNGLSITAIGQHYESQSVYFAEPAAKVIEVFRKQGARIDRDGSFPSGDLYAGIGSTRGEGQAYGKSDLTCGV